MQKYVPNHGQLRSGVFFILDDVFDNWDGVFGIWDNVFGIWALPTEALEHLIKWQQNVLSFKHQVNLLLLK